jgi:hypothetical protein
MKMDVEGFFCPPLLPTCWQHVMRFLGPCSLLTCAMVCHKWREWAHEDRYWSRHMDRVKEKLRMCTTLCSGPLWHYYRDTFLSAAEYLIKTRSLYSAPAHGTWLVTVNYAPERMCCLVDIHFLLPPALGWNKIEVTVKETDGKEGTLDCRSSFFGITCMFDRNVHPKLWRRYHSIVRDTDCSEPRDERVWLRIIKLSF